MSFWKDLPTYSGPTTFGVSLWDKLGQEQTSGGWVAGLDMRTYKLNNDYILTNKSYGGQPLETVSVYFLSWKVDDVSKVTYQTLRGYNFFMTSEFTGCRFVVTNVGVAHVAWSAGGNRATGNASQNKRDLAEFDSLGYGTERPVYRRKLSLSGTKGVLDTSLEKVNTDNVTQSYNDESAMVFGYRVQGGWAFKVIRYASNAGSNTGTWSNFACCWSI